MFIGVSNELEQFYGEKLRFYGSPYIATCGENKDRVIKKLHEDLKSIRKKCVPKYMKEIDAQIKELQKAKQKCNKIFGAV